MRPSPPPGRPAALALAVTGALALSACGEKEEPPVAAPDAGPAPAAEIPGEGEGGAGDARGEAGDTALDPADRRRRAALRTVRAYVDAIDRRSGRRVCALLAPGALDDLRLPRERGSCAASLDASIGYRDPRGLPQFDAARLAQIVSAQAEPESARVTATIVTDFADRAEPSIEDDVIYLERAEGSYRVVKASALLHRAVGIADVPPRVLAPPPG